MTTLARAVVAAVVAFGCLTLVGAAPASARLTLHLRAPRHVVVGRAAVIHATGHIPVSALDIPYWFSLDAIPPSVTRNCPADHWAAVQLAASTGGANLTRDQREQPNARGHFSIPIGVRPSRRGRVLLCGYTDDGLTSTLAHDRLMLHIKRPRHRHAPLAVSAQR
jgi:hypothetical protein